MSEEIPQELVDEARDLRHEVNNWNVLNLNGGQRDAVREVAELVWKKAFEAGHAKGYAEGVHEGGCDFCRF